MSPLVNTQVAQWLRKKIVNRTPKFGVVYLMFKIILIHFKFSLIHLHTILCLLKGLAYFFLEKNLVNFLFRLDIFSKILLLTFCGLYKKE